MAANGLLGLSVSKKHKTTPLALMINPKSALMGDLKVVQI